MELKLKAYEKEFFLIRKKINAINEELVVLLNEIEAEFLFDPFSSEKNVQVDELWEKISNARNFKIY